LIFCFLRCPFISTENKKAMCCKCVGLCKNCDSKTCRRVGRAQGSCGSLQGVVYSRFANATRDFASLNFILMDDIFLKLLPTLRC
jgi:hypothetical protein